MLLEINDLCITFSAGRESSPDLVVDRLNLSVERGRTLALVGESGCGKSVTALALMGLLRLPGRVVSGRILFHGVELPRSDGRAPRAPRGRRIAMIFQEPMTSLNPVLNVGTQVAEPLRVHRGLSRRAALTRAAELLSDVGIPNPELRLGQYPHELSGGLRQRVMIAMALACDPELLIADEPTTALDVTVQAGILSLLRRLQSERGMGMIFITHDLGVVAQLAHDIAVMYAGRAVETGPASDVLMGPAHPYTTALLQCNPQLLDDRIRKHPAGGWRRLDVIAGEPPRRGQRPPGCPFHPRCERGHAETRCATELQALAPLTPNRCCACWKARPPELAVR